MPTHARTVGLGNHKQMAPFQESPDGTECWFVRCLPPGTHPFTAWLRQIDGAGASRRSILTATIGDITMPPCAPLGPWNQTSPRVFANPMSLQTAARHVESRFARRVTGPLLAQEGHHTAVLEALQAAGPADGNRVTETQIAAIALACSGVVHTADHDFRRFPGLKCHFPLQQGA